MRTVKEVSKLTGVSVRTLHYYDAIGLLEPTKITDAGYRMYDDTSLSRLQNILLFRELQFSLKEIKEILDSPNFNQEEAVAQQIKLLELLRLSITIGVWPASISSTQVWLPIYPVPPVTSTFISIPPLRSSAFRPTSSPCPPRA